MVINNALTNLTINGGVIKVKEDKYLQMIIGEEKSWKGSSKQDTPKKKKI